MLRLNVFIDLCYESLIFLFWTIWRCIETRNSLKVLCLINYLTYKIALQETSKQIYDQSMLLIRSTILYKSVLAAFTINNKWVQTDFKPNQSIPFCILVNLRNMHSSCASSISWESHSVISISKTKEKTSHVLNSHMVILSQWQDMWSFTSLKKKELEKSPLSSVIGSPEVFWII